MSGRLRWPISDAAYVAVHQKPPRGYRVWDFRLTGDVLVADLEVLVRVATLDQSLIRWHNCELVIGVPLIVRTKRSRCWHAKMAVSRLVERALRGRAVVVEVAP